MFNTDPGGLLYFILIYYKKSPIIIMVNNMSINTLKSISIEW